LLVVFTPRPERKRTDAEKGTYPMRSVLSCIDVACGVDGNPVNSARETATGTEQNPHRKRKKGKERKGGKRDAKVRNTIS
jgi:hypothetical protein